MQDEKRVDEIQKEERSNPLQRVQRLLRIMIGEISIAVLVLMN